MKINEMIDAQSHTTMSSGADRKKTPQRPLIQEISSVEFAALTIEQEDNQEESKDNDNSKRQAQVGIKRKFRER